MWADLRFQLVEIRELGLINPWVTPLVKMEEKNAHKLGDLQKI